MKGTQVRGIGAWFTAVYLITGAFPVYSSDLDGEWNFHFRGRAIGRSFTVQSSVPKVGHFFQASSFFHQDQEDRKFLESLNEVGGIQIETHPKSRELKVTGGARPETRIFKVDPVNATHSRYTLYLSTTPLSSEQKMVAPGCMEYRGVTERIAFVNEKSLGFYDRTVYVRYEPAVSNASACRDYLDSLKNKIENHQTSAFWLAAEWSGALDLDHFQDLREVDIHFVFK